MVEKLKGVDLEPKSGFQSFIFPQIRDDSMMRDSNVPNLALRSFLQGLGNRSTNYKRGSFGYKEGFEKRLNIAVAQDMILTARPDVVLFIDPNKDDRAAKFSGRIQSRDDGRLLPATVGIFTLMPEETNPLIVLAKTAREPFNTIGILPIPGYVGTVMEDLDGIIVLTQEHLIAWQELYPEKKYFVFDESKPHLAKDFIEDVISEHGKPKNEDWDKKPQGWARFKRNVTGRFRKI